MPAIVLYFNVAISCKLDKLTDKAIADFRADQGVYLMTKTQATAEVFWTAFTVLPLEEKHAVIQRIIRDENLRRELMDLSIIEERRNEPERPLREYLEEKGKRR
jgi:hypothetical protein